ncbi:hypothetical protein P152DRAFT_383747, partial [Eremomyces bilateralis CBS 781.70]
QELKSQVRKRKRTTEAAPTAEPELQPQPPTKCQKRLRRSRSKTPPEFWDNLSRVPLCRRALREFNRRAVRPITSKQRAESVVKGDLVKQLKRFARRGGPDLRDIRGYPEQEAQVKMSSGRALSDKGTDRSSTVNSNTRATSISSKGPAFEQALIDKGIYPYNRGPKPNNWEDIQERLAQPRPSLSPSQFSDGAFEEFQLKNEEAMTEAEVMSQVFPIIRGKANIPSGYNQLFNNLKPLGDRISNAKPDYYNGSRPTQIRSEVRDDLAPYIIPTSQRHRPALPNFFLEAKGPDGKASEAKRQITQDLACGARGMHKMQSYGLDEPECDGNAYAFGSTYHSGTGTLQLYTMHPTEPVEQDGQPEYYTTQARAFALTDNPDSCRQGLRGFRNLQDLAKETRGEFIARA